MTFPCVYLSTFELKFKCQTLTYSGMKKYNVGIIGYSWAAGAHIEAINKTSKAQVTALCSSRKLR